MHVEVSDPAIGRGTHRSALQIQLRQFTRRHGLRQLVLHGLQRVVRLVDFFLRHRLHTQLHAAAGLAPFFRRQRLIVGDICTGFRQRLLIARPVDHEQHLAFLHQLIVHHRYFGQQAADVRRDRHHVGGEFGVTRPRRLGVEHPSLEYGGDAQQHKNQSDRDSGYFYRKIFHSDLKQKDTKSDKTSSNTARC